ncbi:MAG: alpha/beta hydrolase [Bacteroidales bacterium]|nr:alpha/beta hydrolase [Bacteroidales bacterium]
MKTKIALSLIFILALVFGTTRAQSYKQNVITETLYSKYLGYNKKINIYVPSAPYEDYNPQQDQKFNVVYVLDGSVSSKLFDLVIANFAYTNLDLYHNFPPFIVVGINSDNHRSEEFTPQTTDPKTLNRYLFKTYGYGKADAYLNFLEKELFPFIRKNYNVSGDKVGIGHSLGGSLMMYALAVNKDLFNAYFLFSPNLEYGKKQLIKTFELKYPKQSEINRFLYVSVGDIGLENTFKPGILQLDSVVRANHYINFPFTYDSLVNCDHLFSPQRSLPMAIAAYQKLYFPPTQLQKEQFVVSKEGFLNKIKAFYKQKELMLGYDYMPGIDIINNEFVDFLLEENQTDQALKVINWGIRLYPDNYFSYSLYLQKARVLEKHGDLHGAINACQDGFATLNETKSKMDYSDYVYARDELKRKLEYLRKKSEE